MKKVLILVLIAVMLLSLGACSNKNNNQDTGTNMSPNVTTGMSPGMTTGTSPGMTIGTSPGMSPGVTTDMSPGTSPGNNTASNNTFVGSVSEVNGTTIVVTPDDGQAINTNGDKISVSLQDNHNFVVGDKVRVTYDGEITGTDPATVNATKVEEVQ